MMRPESGADFVRWLREADPSLSRRVILCTGGAVTPALRQFEAESGLPVLSKPFSRDELWGTLRRSTRDARSRAHAART